MDIQIPRITRPLDLGGYAPELAGVCVQVWVNPPRDFMKRYWDLVGENDASGKAAQTTKGKKAREALLKTVERIGQDFVGWFAELWSQHPEADTHWSKDEVTKLIKSETDPQLYVWLVGQSMRLVTEHRILAKKK